MRQSSFQRVDIPLSRDIVSEYDDIVIIRDNINGIIAVSNAIESGVDFEDIANVATDVATLQTEMLNKVDKVTGKQLSTEDYTTVEKSKLSFIEDGATQNESDSHLLDRANHFGSQSLDTTTDSVTRLAMTPEERDKLESIAYSANAYMHPAEHPVTIIDGIGNPNKFIKSDATGNTGFSDIVWSDVQNKPVGFTPAAHTHDIADVVSGNLPAERVTVTASRQFVSQGQLDQLAVAELQSNKGLPNGYAPLDATGKINPSFLNSLNVIDVYPVADQASMLALSAAGIGDIAYREDTQLTYMLAAMPASTLANWKLVNVAGVVSVNGQSGTVSLNSDNISEGTLNKYYTDERVDDRVGSLIQAGTNVTVTYDDAANTLTISANDPSVAWNEITSTPTTIGGYGITDAYTKTEVYTKSEVQTSLPVIGLNTSNVTPPTTGQMAWNQTEKTIDVGINGVTLQLGQESLIPVRNGTGISIPNRTVVMATGSIGASGRIVVSPMIGSVPANFNRVLGIATEDIASGVDGFVTTFGKVRGIDTSMWAEGTILYVSTVVDGALTNIKPTTGMCIPIAYVINSHATVGTIFVRVTPLDENAYQPKSNTLTALDRADKYLSALNIANMVYTGSDLTKIQYTAAVDNDYEVLSYSGGNLVGIAHYIGTVLKGNTVLTYSSGSLVSSVFTGV